MIQLYQICRDNGSVVFFDKNVFKKLKKIKKIIFELTINAMHKVKSLRSFSELLKFFKVTKGKFLYFNNKICYIKNILPNYLS